jgi:hypothetical protein
VEYDIAQTALHIHRVADFTNDWGNDLLKITMPILPHGNLIGSIQFSPRRKA